MGIAAQTSYKRTEVALEYISQGYICYGFEKLKSAASTNEVAAQFYLAVCYDKGIIVEKNDVEAFKLYRRTAERGLPDGMYYLSECYQNGLGVNKDENRSREWLQRFQNKGGELTLPDMCEIYNEGVKHNENYAQTPNGNNTVDVNTLAQSNKIVKNAIGSRPVSTVPKTKLKPIVMAANKSDVDVDIPQNSRSNTNTFAVIIGNENYQKVSKVQFAQNDANTFAAYCQKTLGLPQKNVRVYKDATYATMLAAVKDIQNISDAYNGDINVIFYYAGHGIPDESNGSSYLLPIDVDGNQMEVCYSLDRLYSELGALKAKKIMVFMDACFSGSERGDGMLVAARGVAIKAKSTIPHGNMIVFSAATSEQTAYPYEEKGHGMFTYFLLKKMQETKGECSLGELGDYVVERVKRESVVSNGKPQIPSVTSSAAINANWKKWSLK